MKIKKPIKSLYLGLSQSFQKYLDDIICSQSKKYNKHHYRYYKSKLKLPIGIGDSYKIRREFTEIIVNIRNEIITHESFDSGWHVIDTHGTILRTKFEFIYTDAVEQQL